MTQSSTFGRAWRPALLALLVGGVAVALAVRQVHWADVAAALARVSPGWLILAALSHVVAYVSMTARWRWLMRRDPPRPSFSDAFDFLMIGAFASLVLPWKLNDVARAVGAGRYLSTSASALLGTITVERLLDVIVLVVLGAGLTMVMDLPSVIQVGLASVFAGAMLVAASLWLGRSGPIGVLERMVLRRRGPQSRALPPIQQFLIGASAWRHGGNIVPALLATLAAALASAGALAACMMALALPTPWFAGAFVAVVLNVGGVVPAPPAGVGVYHYLVMVALSAWVPDSSAALAAALVMHALSIVVVLTLGGFSLVRKGLSVRLIRRMAATTIDS